MARKLRFTSCCWTSYCGAFIVSVQEQGLPCPECGKKSFICYERPAIQQSIENLEVYCDEKENGCSWTGTLLQLSSHMAGCNYVTIDCPFHCGQIFVRRKLHKHLLEECNMRPQEQQMQEQEQPRNPKWGQSIQELQKEELENCVDPSLDKHTLEFRMENYSSKKENEVEWRSPRMFTRPGEHKFCVSIRTNVFGNKSQNALQVDLWAIKGEFDGILKWPVHASFKLWLVDSKGNKEEHTLDRKEWNKPEDRSQIIAHFESVQAGSDYALIEDDKLQKYLIDDSLTFQILAHDIFYQ